MFLINSAQFGTGGNVKLKDVLTSLGLTSGLQLCLDAGDSASYSGSGQTWSDLSGGGYDFLRGTTSGSESSDPTFNGVAGNQSASEYFSVDGGDYFTLGQTNPAWVQQMHKAGAKFTIVQWAYVNNITSTAQNFFDVGDIDGSGLNGFDIGASGSSLRHVNFQIWNGSAAVYSKPTSGAVNNNAWNFLGISLDMVSGLVSLRLNDVSDDYTSQSFSGTPISGNAGGTLQIAAEGSNVFPSSAGCRQSSIAMWNVGLSSAQLANLFAATRTKFGV